MPWSIEPQSRRWITTDGRTRITKSHRGRSRLCWPLACALLIVFDGLRSLARKAWRAVDETKASAALVEEALALRAAADEGGSPWRTSAPRRWPPPRERRRRRSPNPTPNYLAHVPKTGGHSAAELLGRDAREFFVPPLDSHGGNRTVRVCDMRFKPVADWSTWKNPTCILYTTESHGTYLYSEEPERSFALVRNPIHHVLSQYFHCKESKWHRYGWDRMPSLDAWLDYWADEARARRRRHRGGGAAEPLSLPTMKDEKYWCYEPIDLQSRLLGFSDGRAADPRERFTFMGTLAELGMSTCVMSMLMHGMLPSRCNCTGRQHEVVDHGVRVSHGVKHHGDTFNATPSQRAAIKELTMNDDALYKKVEALLASEVKRLELQYSFKMCR